MDAIRVEKDKTAVKALYKAVAGPGLELIERPEPSVGSGEVKIRVLRAGLCGTDLHIESWDPWASRVVDAPLIPGHEFYGEVVAVGRDVHDIQDGDHVSGEGHVICGTCRNCRAGRRHLCISTSGVGVNRDGAFAEYVVLPATNVWVHKVSIHPDLGAIFDPLGNAVHTALSFPLAGKDVLITGAGPIGMMAAAVCRHAGARFIVITDVSEHRLTLARGMGADIAVNINQDFIDDARRQLGMIEGFDVALEMSGQASALGDGIDSLTHGGRIALLGVPTEPIAIDWTKVIMRMLTIKGIYGRQVFETWYAMTALLQSGLNILPVITDCYAAGDWRAAFATARSGQCGKVVLNWTQF